MSQSSTLQARDPAQRPSNAGQEHAADDGSRSTNERTWLNRRKAKPTEILLPRTVRWMAALPPEFQPTATGELFPRIANALAALSSAPEEFADYLDDLLASTRGHRQGFPPRVMIELHALSAYQATILGTHELTTSRRWLQGHAV